MIVELEFLPGLKSFVLEEVEDILGSAAVVTNTHADDHIIVDYNDSWEHLLTLRTIVAAYVVLPFDIPRPKSLLGHQTFTTITKEIHRIRSSQPSGAFETFTISAAGRDSKVLQRFRRELAEDVHLTYIPDEADLLLRLRPSEVGAGWDVLLRMTPRPLATRDWRVADMPGALNASIAASIVRLLHPYDAPLVNLMCGSATLLIEHQHIYPKQWGLGIETDAEALTCARANIQAARATDITLTQMDATQTALSSNSAAYLVADLPWGQLVGDYQTLDTLYQRTLAEAYRIAKPHAHFAVLTHAIDKFEAICKRSSWHLQAHYSIFQGGLHPKLYLLARN